jgi:hypothetical protein
MARIITCALFTAVAAGTWDAWWHTALGRESFWSPPHLLLYISTILAIVLGLSTWLKTRKPVWRNLAIALLFVPLSAPFDEIWHQWFGEETVNSLLIMWSPPHLVLIGSIIASFILLLPLLEKDSDRQARMLFGALTFAGIYNLLLFVVIPFEPLHVHHLLGFWGTGVVSFVLGTLILSAQRWISGVGSAFMAALVILSLEAIGFSKQLAPNLDIAPHDHAQSWIVVFSVLLPAVIIDILHNKPLWLKGLLWGGLWATILYGLAGIWFEPQFQYSSGEALQAIIASGIGGFLAGSLLLFQKS